MLLEFFAILPNLNFVYILLLDCSNIMVTYVIVNGLAFTRATRACYQTNISTNLIPYTWILVSFVTVNSDSRWNYLNLNVGIITWSVNNNQYHNISFQLSWQHVYVFLTMITMVQQSFQYRFTHHFKFSSNGSKVPILSKNQFNIKIARLPNTSQLGLQSDLDFPRNRVPNAFTNQCPNCWQILMF